MGEAFRKGFSPADAGLLEALFIGERSHVDDRTMELFQKTGTLHLLAVSGFNVGFVYLGVLLLLRLLPAPRIAKSAMILASIWAYCLIVGWQAPVVRASVMASMFLIGDALGRRTDPLNTLGLAALVILAVRPAEVFDAGFQLSFLAVCGIVAATPVFYKPPKPLPFEKWSWRERAGIYVIGLFWVSFAATLFTLPVTLQRFYTIAPLAPLVNVLVIPAVTVLFFLGAAYLALAVSFGALWAAWPAKGLIVGLLAVLRGAEAIPGGYLITGRLGAPFWAALVGGIVFFLLTKRLRRAWRRAGWIVALVAAVLIAQAAWRGLHREFRVLFFDVGQGDAAYVEFPGGRNLLVDAGNGGSGDDGRWVITPYLKSIGVSRIDTVAVSHAQEDHAGGLATVLREFKVGRIIEGDGPYPVSGYGDLGRRIRAEGAETLPLSRGGKVPGLPADAVVLNPRPGSTADINEGSLVLRMKYASQGVLFTGDIGDKAIPDMLTSDLALDADVLKVPHHGGRAGEAAWEFFRAVNPRFSVVSAGERNSYGHPAAETLRALEAVPGNRVFRTDRDGAIECKFNGDTFLCEPAVPGRPGPYGTYKKHK